MPKGNRVQKTIKELRAQNKQRKCLKLGLIWLHHIYWPNERAHRSQQIMDSGRMYPRTLPSITISNAHIRCVGVTHCNSTVGRSDVHELPQSLPWSGLVRQHFELSEQDLDMNGHRLYP